MTKKQVDRKKVSIKLDPGESFVVLDHDTLMHLAYSCDLFADQQIEQEDMSAWRDLADIIRGQCQSNYYASSSVDSEEW